MGTRYLRWTKGSQNRNRILVETTLVISVSIHYEKMQIDILKYMKQFWSRVLSLDLETSVPEPTMFLTDERILSVSFSRRVSGELMQASGVETKTLFLESDDDESEVELLNRLDYELGLIRPLCVIGYGLRQYDIPLLCIKKQRYGLLLWKIIDLCESSIHIDLYHILKYQRYKRFEDAIFSPDFASLPLKRSKRLVTSDREQKGKEIYRLWREDRDRLKEYQEGDVFDTLLLSERIMEEIF